MSLWPHQQRAIEQAREAIARGARAPLIVCPTGGGKTRIGVDICSGALARGKRVLWLAHRAELVDQAAEDLRRNGANGVGFIRAGAEPDPSQPIQVASIQTLVARGVDCLPSAEIVVFDEAHHYVAALWQEIAAHYARAIRVGLTATPQRSDGTALGNLFDALISIASIRELTEAGFLVPCRVIRPELRQEARTIAQDPITAYRDLAPRTQAIVFCTNVDEAKSCAERFKSVGVPAACVDGKMPARERNGAIEQFKAGRIRVLTNCYVLTEGFNHPSVETCILARSCGVLSTYLQIVGRVLRSAPGKKQALLIDLTGVVMKHGLPDDDREWTLDGNGHRKNDAAVVAQCPVHGYAFRPSQGCPECQERQRSQPVPIRISGDRLIPVARSEDVSELEKEIYHARLQRECAAKGYKPGWVHHSFVAKFGHAYGASRERTRQGARGLLHVLGGTSRKAISPSTFQALTRVSRALAASGGAT